MSGLKIRKCEYCHKKCSTPCETLNQAESCIRYKFINPKNIKTMKSLIVGTFFGLLFILLLLSGCAVKKGCPGKITSTEGQRQKEILFGALTSEQIQSIQEYYAKNPNTTDSIVVQPWMGSEVIKN